MTAEEERRSTRLVLAQPYELLSDALGQLLASAGLEVVGCCDCANDLERCVRTYAPDIALVDADMAPGGDVAALVRAVLRGLGRGRLVLLAREIDPGLARETLALAVDGVVLKCGRSADVVAALQRVAAGDDVFPAGWIAAARRVHSSALDQLSPRQAEVLELLAKGLPNELIAERLFISRNTVKFHVAAIYQRLGVSNRVQAAQALDSLRLAG
jgi:DNA-binding NarL/FixJ family response regulator